MLFPGMRSKPRRLFSSIKYLEVVVDQHNSHFRKFSPLFIVNFGARNSWRTAVQRTFVIGAGEDWESRLRTEIFAKRCSCIDVLLAVDEGGRLLGVMVPEATLVERGPVGGVAGGGEECVRRCEAVWVSGPGPCDHEGLVVPVGSRGVVFEDGHGEVVAEEEFQRVMERWSVIPPQIREGL